MCVCVRACACVCVCDTDFAAAAYARGACQNQIGNFDAAINDYNSTCIQSQCVFVGGLVCSMDVYARAIGNVDAAINGCNSTCI